MQMMFQPFLRFYIKYSVSRVTPVATVRFQPFLRFYIDDSLCRYP